MLGTCKLCLRTEVLQDSHVIPEFSYKPLYDHKHRATRIEAGSTRKRFLQKGLREQLLCLGCEGRLNQWYEMPFYRYWFKRRALPSNPAAGAIRINGFDYSAFKLFHLSVLWRSAVATMPEFGKVCDLGPYQEKLRLMLLSRDPGPADHYPILGQVLLDSDSMVMFDVILEPTVGKIDSSRVFMFCFAGCEWFYFLTDHPWGMTRDILPAAPSKHGSMVLNGVDWQKAGSVQRFVENRRRFGRRAA